MLFEVMLGMAIFAIGVVALGECVNNCINAQVMKNDDQRARLALENRMGQIESGEISLTSAKTDTLTGMFDGITLKQSRTALNEKNEKNEPLGGLWSVSLEASWKRGNQEQSKSLSFYVFSLK